MLGADVFFSCPFSSAICDRDERTAWFKWLPTGSKFGSFDKTTQLQNQIPGFQVANMAHFVCADHMQTFAAGCTFRRLSRQRTHCPAEEKEKFFCVQDFLLHSMCVDSTRKCVLICLLIQERHKVQSCNLTREVDSWLKRRGVYPISIY